MSDTEAEREWLKARDAEAQDAVDLAEARSDAAIAEFRATFGDKVPDAIEQLIAAFLADRERFRKSSAELDAKLLAMGWKPLVRKPH
jgi:hypothetical protein